MRKEGIIYFGKQVNFMASLAERQEDIQEKKLYKELDKGIDDMENGRVVPHEEAMKKLMERFRHNAV